MNGKKKKTYLNLAIFALLIGGMFYYMNEYLIKNIERLGDEVVDAKKSGALITERNIKINEVRKNYENIEKEIGLISNTFVEKNYEKVGEMFMELESIAQKYNIELTKDPASKPEERMGNRIFAAYFNMTATGDYQDLMKFMLYMDNFKYYVDLNNIEIIRSNEDEDSNPKVSLRAELEVYLENKNNK